MVRMARADAIELVQCSCIWAGAFQGGARSEARGEKAAAAPCQARVAHTAAPRTRAGSAPRGMHDAADHGRERDKRFACVLGLLALPSVCRLTMGHRTNRTRSARKRKTDPSKKKVCRVYDLTQFEKSSSNIGKPRK